MWFNRVYHRPTWKDVVQQGVSQTYLEGCGSTGCITDLPGRMWFNRVYHRPTWKDVVQQGVSQTYLEGCGSTGCITDLPGRMWFNRVYHRPTWKDVVQQGVHQPEHLLLLSYHQKQKANDEVQTLKVPNIRLHQCYCATETSYFKVLMTKSHFFSVRYDNFCN